MEFNIITGSEFKLKSKLIKKQKASVSVRVRLRTRAKR
jgi:hypothetical protein